MTRRVLTLAATEARLLVRDWTVLVFAFVFPPFVMLVLAGVFGTAPSDGYGGKRPDEYYVAASIGVPIIALTLVGLPVTLASYRERGVLRRLQAFGVPTREVLAAHALVAFGLVAVGAAVILAVALPTYGIPSVSHPVQTLLGVLGATAALAVLGVAIGLAVPTARAAQAVGLLAFFPLYLLGGGGPPHNVMPKAMQAISDALPSAIPAITRPWLGMGGLGSSLAVLAAWAAAGAGAAAWLSRRAGA